MENSTQIKENMIQNYIMNIDFKSQDFSIAQMKTELRAILHETPGIEVGYNKERTITEDKKTGEKFMEIKDDVKSVTVAFSDGEHTADYGEGKIITTPKMHKFTYYIG